MASSTSPLPTAPRILITMDTNTSGSNGSPPSPPPKPVWFRATETDQSQEEVMGTLPTPTIYTKRQDDELTAFIDNITEGYDDNELTSLTLNFYHNITKNDVNGAIATFEQIANLFPSEELADSIGLYRSITYFDDQNSPENVCKFVNSLKDNISLNLLPGVTELVKKADHKKTYYSQAVEAANYLEIFLENMDIIGTKVDNLQLIFATFISHEDSTTKTITALKNFQKLLQSGEINAINAIMELITSSYKVQLVIKLLSNQEKLALDHKKSIYSSAIQELTTLTTLIKNLDQNTINMARRIKAFLKHFQGVVITNFIKFTSNQNDNQFSKNMDLLEEKLDSFPKITMTVSNYVQNPSVSVPKKITFSITVTGKTSEFSLNAAPNSFFQLSEKPKTSSCVKNIYSFNGKAVDEDFYKIITFNREYRLAISTISANLLTEHKYKLTEYKQNLQLLLVIDRLNPEGISPPLTPDDFAKSKVGVVVKIAGNGDIDVITYYDGIDDPDLGEFVAHTLDLSDPNSSCMQQSPPTITKENFSDLIFRNSTVYTLDVGLYYTFNIDGTIDNIFATLQNDPSFIKSSANEKIIQFLRAIYEHQQSAESNEEEA